jgi:hypothetical protein
MSNQEAALFNYVVVCFITFMFDTTRSGGIVGVALRLLLKAHAFYVVTCIINFYYDLVLAQLPIFVRMSLVNADEVLSRSRKAIALASRFFVGFGFVWVM